MTNHHDRVKYLSDRVAIERNVVKSLEREGKDATKAKHNLACAEYLYDQNRKLRMDLVKDANVMAKEKWFWVFMEVTMDPKMVRDFRELPHEAKAERAGDYIRERCGIVSFKDLKTNEAAQEKMKELAQQFKDFRRYKVVT